MSIFHLEDDSQVRNILETPSGNIKDKLIEQFGDTSDKNKLQEVLFKLPFAFLQMEELAVFIAKLSKNEGNIVEFQNIYGGPANVTLADAEYDEEAADDFFEKLLGLTLLPESVWDEFISDQIIINKYFTKYNAEDNVRIILDKVLNSIEIYEFIENFIDKIFTYYRAGEFRKINIMAEKLCTNSKYDNLPKSHMLSAISRLFNLNGPTDKQSLCASILGHFAMQKKFGIPLIRK
jgi:hypothetical protein